jgi:hypothetical protein
MVATRRVWLLAMASTGCLWMLPAGALAQETRDDVTVPTASAGRTADRGGLSPWSMAPRGDLQQGVVNVVGGYDGARKGAAFETAVELRLLGPLSIRAGGSYVGPDGEVRPLVAGKVDLLRQERAGLDLAVAGGYEPHGFNTVPAVGALVAAGREVGPVYLMGNLGYGLGLEEGEHFGDARLAALGRVAPNLRVGVDSRLRIDLERDSDEPEGEPDWELLAGPLATVSLGRFAVTGGAGLSAIRMRLEKDTQVGALGYLGLGAVF